MIVLLILLLVALILSLLQNHLLFKLLKKVEDKRRRDWNFAREMERELLDRIMHMSGNTWTPPPRDTQEMSEEEQEALELARKRREEGWIEV